MCTYLFTYSWANFVMNRLGQSAPSRWFLIENTQLIMFFIYDCIVGGVHIQYWHAWMIIWYFTVTTLYIKEIFATPSHATPSQFNLWRSCTFQLRHELAWRSCTFKLLSCDVADIYSWYSIKFTIRVGFLPGRKVFLPCHGEKLGRNTFLPGRNGRKWGERGETIRCVYFKAWKCNDV